MLARRFGARRRLVMVAAIATLVLFGSAVAVLAQAPPNIDTFATSQATLNTGVLNPDFGNATDGGAGGIIGSQREAHVVKTVGPNPIAVIFNGSTMSISTGDATNGVTTLTYDGATNSNADPNSVDPIGLCTGGAGSGCVNLTQSGTTNAFRFVVPSDDTTGDLTVTVWGGDTGTGKCSKTITGFFPGGFALPVSPAREFFFEYPAVLSGTCSGNTTNLFSKSGAIQFQITGPALDMTIDTIDISVLDWGDLPEDGNCTTGGLTAAKYATTMACQGPRHVVTSGLRLGATIDPGVSPSSQGEINGQPTVSAKGDDIANIDDEDGVVPVGVWSTGSPPLNGGTVQVTVQGSGRLVGWIDWAGDGFQASDVIINQDVSSSASNYSFLVPITLPASPDFVTLYARFRLFPRLEVNAGLWQYAFDGRDQSAVFTPPLTPPGQSKGGEVEDHVYYVSSTSLAVTLASFTADAQADGVLVGWETTSEINNAGFNLYRAESATGAQTKLNADLIPSQAPGSSQGALYEYLDANVASGQTYWYWLESVDISGATTLNGPVSVDVSAPTAVALTDLQADSSTAAQMPWLVAAVAVAGLGLLVGSRRRRNSLR